MNLNKTSVLRASRKAIQSLLLESKGEDMKGLTGFVGAILLVLNGSEASSAVRIANDRGGRIGPYIVKYQHLASSGESVMIDGLCASACTTVLSALPHNKICVTSRATLGFHAAWNYGANGRTFTDPEATLMLYSAYPRPVRRWIARRGGLKPHIIFSERKAIAGDVSLVLIELAETPKPCAGSSRA